MTHCCLFKQLQFEAEVLRTTDVPGTTAALAGIERLPQIAGALAVAAGEVARGINADQQHYTEEALRGIVCRSCAEEFEEWRSGRRAKREAARAT